MTVIQTPNGYHLDTGGRRVVVDPVTRIEGHMRCEVNLDENNIIRNAVSSGTMWRGLEVILKGRDPRDAWAFVQRICGVCTGTHALTSIRAVEDALKMDIPDNANDYSASNLLMPRGAIINGDLSKVHEVDLTDPEQIQEFVPHSWYAYPDDLKGLHPYDGITDPHFKLGNNTVGTKTHIKELDENAKYSWIKAPRWRGHAMEVGPLARYVIGYAQGNKEITEQINFVLKTLDVPVDALFSTLGRTAARGLEGQWAAGKMRYFMDKLMLNIKAGDLATANVTKWHPDTWPAHVKGVGFTEAPRGALGHWLVIKDTKIENYQCVVPTTWNGSPRDEAGNIGAFEAALMNTKVERPEEPVEILRTLHSFDPCLACSTHVMSPDGTELTQVKVR